MQYMKERLKWKNNNGSTSKAFGKFETTNYVVDKTLVDEWNDEHAAQCTWFTLFSKAFDNFHNSNTLEIPTISRLEWKNFQWNFQQLWPIDKIVRKHKLLEKLLIILSFSKLNSEHLDNSTNLECRRS
jgi:hypothetical protein